MQFLRQLFGLFARLYSPQSPKKTP
jgi:hypothetical protein